MINQTHASKTKLLDAALQVFRAKSYSATTVDDICHAAGVTKGSFFHHFTGKEELAIESTRHWTKVTGGLFATAPYQQQGSLWRFWGVFVSETAVGLFTLWLFSRGRWKAVKV